MIDSLRRRATLRIPDFASATCRGYSAHYDMNPDANLILDQSPTVDGLFRAAGFSGHGFKLSPVIGRMIAELALHGRCQDHPVERFRLGRFADGEPLLAEHPTGAPPTSEARHTASRAGYERIKATPTPFRPVQNYRGGAD